MISPWTHPFAGSERRISCYMKNDPIRTVLWAVLTIAGIVLGIAIFWPLLIMIAIAVAVMVLRLRHTVKRAEQELFEQMNRMNGGYGFDSSDSMQRPMREENALSYQNDLFQESVKRAERMEGEIVDVEFTRKEPAQAEQEKGERQDV